MERMVFGKNTGVLEMSQDGHEKKKKYLIPLEGNPPLYIDSELSDEQITNFASELKGQSNLMRGLILGLLLGIIGNIFASHYYEVFRVGVAMLFGEGSLHFVNIVMIWVYLFVIGIFSWYVYKIVKASEVTSSRLEEFVWKKQHGMIVVVPPEEKEEKENA